MYSTWHVQREIQAVKRSSEAPLKKVRRLLGLCRKLRSFGASLGTGLAILRDDCDDNGAGRLETKLKEIRTCVVDLRVAAWDILKSTHGKALAFGYEPRLEAHPENWVGAPTHT